MQHGSAPTRPAQSGVRAASARELRKKALAVAEELIDAEKKTYHRVMFWLAQRLKASPAAVAAFDADPAAFGPAIKAFVARLQAAWSWGPSSRKAYAAFVEGKLVEFRQAWRKVRDPGGEGPVAAAFVAGHEAPITLLGPLRDLGGHAKSVLSAYYHLQRARGDAPSWMTCREAAAQVTKLERCDEPVSHQRIADILAEARDCGLLRLIPDPLDAQRVDEPTKQKKRKANVHVFELERTDLYAPPGVTPVLTPEPRAPLRVVPRQDAAYADQVINAWNERVASKPGWEHRAVRIYQGDLIRQIKAAEPRPLEFWLEVFDRVAQSRFCRDGSTNGGMVWSGATLGWCLDLDHAVRALEGTYDDPSAGAPR